MKTKKRLKRIEKSLEEITVNIDITQREIHELRSALCEVPRVVCVRTWKDESPKQDEALEPPFEEPVTVKYFLLIGDKVRIKSLEWYNANKDEHGNIYVNGNFFSSQMAEFCGKEAKITCLLEWEDFKIDIDNGEFWWSEEMFEPVPEEKAKPKVERVLEEPVAEKRTLKVGDKVRIKSLEWYNANKDEHGNIYEGGVCFVHSMFEFCGKEAEITRITDDGNFRIDLDGGAYFWSECMFE